MRRPGTAQPPGVLPPGEGSHNLPAPDRRHDDTMRRPPRTRGGRHVDPSATSPRHQGATNSDTTTANLWSSAPIGRVTPGTLRFSAHCSTAAGAFFGGYPDVAQTLGDRASSCRNRETCRAPAKAWNAHRGPATENSKSPDAPSVPPPGGQARISSGAGASAAGDDEQASPLRCPKRLLETRSDVSTRSAHAAEDDSMRLRGAGGRGRRTSLRAELRQRATT
jgi:hypothetical protein